jgi:hypothetical protein
MGDGVLNYKGKGYVFSFHLDPFDSLYGRWIFQVAS